MPWLWYPEGQEGTIAQLRRGTLLKVDDSGSQQIIKKLRGLASELPEDIYRAQSHGFTSHPPKDSEGLFLSLGSRSDRIIAWGFEHKDHRPKDLPEGTAQLYDDKGNRVFVKGKDGIEIHAKDGKVYVKPGEGKNVYLGGTGDDGTYAKVMTESGPSANVYAKI